MKKTLPILFMAMVLPFLAFAQKAPKPPKLKTWQDSVSYALGIDIAKNLSQNSIKVTSKMLAKGMDDQTAGKAAWNEEQVGTVMEMLQMRVMSEKQKEADAAVAKNKAAGEAWLKENGAKPGVMTTASGLQYKVITEGTGVKPTLANQVEAHYEGKLIDGTIFDSSYERGETATFPLGQVILGWQEGLQLMSVGSKYELYIPSNLAYGDENAPPAIGPGQVLIFTVELISVK